jgi:hypothetical protein
LVSAGQCGLLKTLGRSAGEVPEERMLQQEMNQRPPVIKVRRARLSVCQNLSVRAHQGHFKSMMPGQPNYRAVSRFSDLKAIAGRGKPKS